MGTTEADVVVEHVVKRFGSTTAVNDLSFEVPRGSIYGFLGRNGAGKTTTLRMATGILTPTSGDVRVLGSPPGPEISKSIGYLAEERGLYKSMSAVRMVAYFGRLKGMARKAALNEASDLLDRLGLSRSRNKSVDSLSKGMAQKVQLATAVVNSPQLLILDEPFSGLDPANQGDLEDLILGHARAGGTVLFSTHVMQHAERLCERLLFIADGCRVFEGTPDQARRLEPSRIVIKLKKNPSALSPVDTATSIAPAEDEWVRWRVSLKRGATSEDLLSACYQEGLEIHEFQEERPTLHDVFIKLTKSVREGRAYAGSSSDR